jgi:signal transduction histidine kinase
MNMDRGAKTTLVEEELISSVAWFIRVRWIAGVGVLTAVWFATTVLRITLPVVPLSAVGLSILAYNVVFRVLLDRLLRAEPRVLARFNALILAQIGLDWLAMTALVHYTGGLESPALFYFLFHIIIAAILLPPGATYLSTAVAALMIGATGVLEYAGLLPHVHIFEFIGVELYRNPVFLFGEAFFLFSTLFVAAYLATTLNGRLRQREKQVVELSVDLRRANDRLQTLYENAKAVSSTLELEQVMDRLVRQTADALGVRACSIRLLDESGQRLYVAAVYGLSEAYVKKGDLLLDRNPLAREVLAGKTVTSNDVTVETGLQYRPEALAEGICSMLSAPLPGKKRVLGLVRAYSTERNHFTSDDAAFLSAIAGQGSTAIENALAYQQLSQLDEMKSKFVLTATHELRSPVGVVRSLLRTITGGYAGSLTEEQRDLIARASRRADFLQTLIDDLLDLAAGKSEPGTPETLEIVVLDQVVERIVARFESEAREKSVRLEWHSEASGQPITISATNDGVDRIVNNLVSNAVKYTPAGGQVSVSLGRVAGDWVLRIKDSGIGIPEEALPHLFEEFYRAPNARSQEKQGTGLGLAISKDLVTRFHGQIRVQSRLGQGTTFEVTFPVVES